MRSVSTMLAVAIVGLAAGRPAAADTVETLVVIGSLEIGGSLMGSHSGTLELSGDRGFTMQARVSSVGGNYRPLEDCRFGCNPDSALDLSAIWVGSDIFGTSTFESTTFVGFSGGNPDSASASVQFTGIAALPAALTPSAVVSAPFRFTGLFRPGAGPPVNLFGGGIATVFLEHLSIPGFDIDAWGVRRIRYDLTGSTGDPIPEPATFLLLAAGVGGMVLRRARRAHQ